MPLKSAHRNAALALATVVAASIAAYFYLQHQVYYPVVRLTLSDDLSIAAVLPEAKGRGACSAANERFITPFRACKDCRVVMADCERQLEGLELAMHEGKAVPYPTVVARGLRLAVMGPPQKARAGCELVAARMVSGGVPTAVCIKASTP